MNDKKQIEDKKQLIEILKNSKDIVSYEPNAREIPFWGSDKRKFFIQDDNGHLTIHLGKIVDEIYTQGYRKIPEGSVVLSKEEYEALRLIEKYHIKSCGKNSVVLTTEEYHKLKMLEKYHITCEDVSEYITNARKQAIKEYCDKLKKVIHERDYVSGYAEIGLQEEINELAKEFGVEL